MLPGVLLALLTLLVAWNRLEESLFQRMAYIDMGSSKPLDCMQQNAGGQCFFKNFNDLEFHNGVPYIWASDKVGEIVFVLRIPHQLRLELTVSSPFFAEQGLKVGLNGVTVTHIVFPNSCADRDLLCIDASHHFSLLLPARQGKNVITVAFDHARQADGASTDSRNFASILLGVRLVPEPSAFDQLVRSAGTFFNIHPAPETMFGPVIDGH